MKYINVITVIVLCCLNSLNAQDTIQAQNTIQKNKIYTTWVSLNSEPFKIKGVLYEVKDSSILVSSSVVVQDYSTDKFEIVKLHIYNIETIKTRRYTNIGKGFLIGAITGFTAGSLTGLISGDDPPDVLWPWTAGEKAIIFGGSLAVGGAVIGALIGSIKVKIPIRGSIDNYNKNKNKLTKHSLKK